jgi:hypothetical protein
MPSKQQSDILTYVLHTMFRNTLFAGSVSQKDNKMAQAYAIFFGSTHAHLMKRKGEAHETLSLVFQRNGVPPTMVTDDSKGQTKLEFRCKLKEADCVGSRFKVRSRTFSNLVAEYLVGGFMRQ